jgi:hypothetical protein
LYRKGCFLFVDEMGTHTSLAPVYAYAPIGERAFFEIPRETAARTPGCLRAFSSRRDGTFYGRGRSDHRPRLCNLREAFAGSHPEARTGCGDGQSLGAHRPRRVRELVEERRCEFIYLPSYSADLNLIEEALSKVKLILRKVGARTKDALIDAMGVALATVSAQDVREFFAHYGYRTPAHQL